MMKELKNRDIVIAGKRFVMPFELSLTKNGGSLKCFEMLRLVPGKRAVVLGTWRDEQIIAKLFFKPLRSGQHVKQEIEGNLLLKKANIPTSDIIFSGTALNENIKIVLFNYIHPSKNFGDFLNSCKDFKLYRQYLRKLMTLLGNIHQAALQHNDLHLNNFLIKDDSIYALDGASLEKKNSAYFLDVDKSLKNLSTIFIKLKINDNALFLDLVNSYLITRNLTMDKDAMCRFETMIKKEADIKLNKYLNKIYRSSTENICEQSLTSFMLCKRKLYTPAMKAFLQNPDIAFQIPEIMMLKAGNSATLVRFNVDGTDFVIKRYNMKNFFHGLRRAFKKSRADRSWYNAHLLLWHGIATPSPVALKENRFGPFRNKAYFICEYVEGVSAQHYFKDTQSPEKNIVSKKIIEMFTILKKSMISHGDMKATNIIINGAKPFLIDLDSMALHNSNTLFVRAQRKDIKRFMKNWADQPEVFRLFTTLKNREM